MDFGRPNYAPALHRRCPRLDRLFVGQPTHNGLVQTFVLVLCRQTRMVLNSVPQLKPNIDCQRGDPFRTLRRQSPLLRNNKGRLLIPDRRLFDPHRCMVSLSDRDLNVIYAELLRNRRLWRARFYLKTPFLLFFLVWTFCLMPLAASHHWPFH